ncbi:two-component sensor histidine kinase [Paenibacillus selenitireducens]|uniref:histidine kinase n=2 Tax=Paenibacillus selenitireducens TaxID=1324314 RepID=A0A1T2X276_9BACL|nr:two-component sensor histidine kinase [Paenibacillus selenitireducens]
MAIVSVCLALFYRHEKKRYVTIRIHHMIEEVRYIAAGNFHRQVEVVDNYELGALAVNINNIVVQAQKSMEEERMAEKIKNDLVTNVSHDLRTPLTSIVGYLNLINEDKYRDEVELRYYTQILHDKVTRLHELINDLFEFTRMQNKGLMLHKEPINLAEMLDQLAVQFHIQFQQAGMECRQNYEVRHPIVPADGRKLVRVFENLISNAITYGKEGKYIDIKLQDTEQAVIVDITNYGEGIPAIDLPHIFDRFYRVEKSRSEYSGGSGLGLAIAKSIMDLHEGDILVSSDMESTTFQVRLPK